MVYGVELEHLDKHKNYLYYFPNYNPETVIKKYSFYSTYSRLNQLLKLFFNKRLAVPIHSLYSFYFIPIKKGYKMRRLAESKELLIHILFFL